MLTQPEYQLIPQQPVKNKSAELLRWLIFVLLSLLLGTLFCKAASPDPSGGKVLHDLRITRVAAEVENVSHINGDIDFILTKVVTGVVTDPTELLNNVGSVFISAGVAGNFRVRVRPAAINAYGIPKIRKIAECMNELKAIYVI